MKGMPITMNYVVTTDELVFLTSLFAQQKSAFSQNAVRNTAATVTAAVALSEIGLVIEGRLTKEGEAIANALQSPEKHFEIASAALIDTPVASFYRYKGTFIVFLPEPYKNLIGIFIPDDIDAFIEELLFGEKLPAFSPYSLSLTAPEAAVFALSHFLIEQRIQEHKRPLKKEEQSFTATDVFAEENLVNLALKLDKLPNDTRESILRSVNNAAILVPALVSLMNKDVLTVTDLSGQARFGYTASTRSWLMNDVLLDTISVKSIIPEKKPELYRLTTSGLLKIREEDGGMIVYESVPTLSPETI